MISGRMSVVSGGARTAAELSPAMHWDHAGFEYWCDQFVITGVLRCHGNRHRRRWIAFDGDRSSEWPTLAAAKRACKAQKRGVIPICGT